MGTTTLRMVTKRVTPKGRRIRLPLSVVYSHHHSPLAVAVYGLVDLLSGPERPYEARRDVMAARLGASVGGVAKALAALGTAHTGKNAVTPDSPVLMISKPRGKGWTAERVVIPGVPFVDLPEWVLGDDVAGPLVEHQALRLYATILNKRAPGRPWCTLPRADLAKLIRVRPDSLPKLCRQLAAAGMLLVVDRPGDTTLYLPMLEQLADDDAVRAELVDAVRAACAQPVEKPANPLNSDDSPHAPTGSTPHASTGTDPGSSAGSANRGSDLDRGDLSDPRGAAPAPCGAGGPANPDVAAATAAAADRIAAARAIIAASRERFTATRDTRTGGFAALVEATAAPAGPWAETLAS